MSMRSLLLAGLFSAFLMPSLVNAGILGSAGDYNVFTLGDFTEQGTDSIGRVAVGGKFDPGGTVGSSVLNGSGSFTVASGNPSSTAATPNLVVGGDFRNSGTSLNGDAWIKGNAFFHTPTVSGNITTGGNLTADSGGFVNGNISYAGTLSNNEGYKFYGGTSTHLSSPPAAPFSFATEGANLKQLSSTLDGMKSTGTTSFTGNAATHTMGGLTLTGTNSHQDIFHVNGADLALANSLVINAVAGETVVIDINGSVDQMVAFGINLNNIDNHHVIYNFSNATNLTFNNIAVEGTVLAPFADINFVGGNIDGTMIGNSIKGGGEFHSFLFNGNVNLPLGANPLVSPVPEPSTLVTAFIGLLSVWLYRRRALV